MNKVLKNWASEFKFGKEQRYRNITFIPISTTNRYDFDFLTLSKGLGNSVEITELEDGATVPKVMVKNKSSKYLIIFDGEHLIGAKQNRIVNKTIIVKPNSELVIPVSCTEQGRWHHVTREFSKSAYNAPASVRTYTKLDKHSQRNIWRDIDKIMCSFAVHSETSSLNDLYNEVNPTFEDYQNEIYLEDSQIGFAVFLNGSFYGAELINNTEIFSEMFEGITKSYLLDAADIYSEVETQIDNDNLIKILLEELYESKLTEAKKIGMEERETVKGSETIGEFVAFNGIPVHLALFNQKELN